MDMKLRHSHIAVRAGLDELARTVGADILSGEDDFGRYHYFDVAIAHRGVDNHVMRFAAHDGDRMVHLLAERIQEVDDLALALCAVGMTGSEALSISTDQDGRPVRSAGEISEHIGALSRFAAAGALEIMSGGEGVEGQETTTIALNQ